jgi:hypothetical protein
MGTQFRLNTPLVATLLDRLESELPAELASRASGLEPEDAALLAAPGYYLDHAPPPGELEPYLGNGPVLGILDVESRLEDDTGSDVTGYHELGIVVYLFSPEYRLLPRAMRRYLGAVASVALRGRALGTSASETGDGAWGTGARTVQWGPAMRDPDHGGQLVMWSTFVMWARRSEVG